MYARSVEIQNKTGLHARPASDFVLKAKTFASRVTIRNLDEADAEAVNAKSIVRLLAEGMGQGTHIEICADGPDERDAAEALCALVASGFGE